MASEIASRLRQNRSAGAISPEDLPATEFSFLENMIVTFDDLKADTKTYRSSMDGSHFSFWDRDPEILKSFIVIAGNISFEVGRSSLIDPDGNRGELIEAARQSSTALCFPGQCPPPDTVEDAASAFDFLSNAGRPSLVGRARGAAALAAVDKIFAHHGEQKSALDGQDGPDADMLRHVADAEAFFGLAQRAADLTGLAVDGKNLPLEQQARCEEIWIGLSNAGARSSLRALEIAKPEAAFAKMGLTNAQEFEHAMSLFGTAPLAPGETLEKGQEMAWLSPEKLERYRAFEMAKQFSVRRNREAAQRDYERFNGNMPPEAKKLLNASAPEISSRLHHLTDVVVSGELRTADRDRAAKLRAFKMVAWERSDALSQASIENRENALKEGLFLNQRDRREMILMHSVGKIVAKREEDEIEAQRKSILQGASVPGEGVRREFLKANLGAIVLKASEKIDMARLSREAKVEIAAARRVVFEDNLPRAQPEAIAAAASTIGRHLVNSSDKVRLTLRAAMSVAREDLPQLDRPRDRSMPDEHRG